MDDLTARAHALQESGTDRHAAFVALCKSIALQGVAGDTAAARAAVNEVYGAENQPDTDAGTQQAAVPATEGEQGGVQPALRLPGWQHVRAANPPAPAPQLIGGLLRRGHVGAVVAKAKSHKSWLVTDLSVSIAAGVNWLGNSCTRGTVLYIDPELDVRSLDRRFFMVAQAKGVDPAAVDASVFRWSLRGVTVGRDRRAPSITDVAHDIGLHVALGDIARDDLALVVIDSCSALLAGDENSAIDVRGFFLACQRIAEATGASVMLVHHEGKAASGDRDAMARGRGSSAWADCPDLVLSLVELFPPSGEVADYLQDGERAFRLEVAAIREFPPAGPRWLIWRYPLLEPDADGITDGWKPKSSQQAAGRASGDARRSKAQERAHACTCALLAHMYRHGTDSAEGIPASKAAEICTAALGSKIKPQTLKEYVEQSTWLDVYQRSPQRWAVVPAHPRPEQLRTE